MIKTSGRLREVEGGEVDVNIGMAPVTNGHRCLTNTQRISARVNPANCSSVEFMVT